MLSTDYKKMTAGKEVFVIYVNTLVHLMIGQVMK